MYIKMRNIIKHINTFLNAEMPFSIQHKEITKELWEAVYDSRHQQNLHGPFDSAEKAIADMLKD